MTDPRAWLDEAQRLAGNATPGPWWEDDQIWAGRVEDGATIIAHPETDPDATFIAAARTDLPRALSALRAVLDLCDRSNRPNATKLLHPGDVRRVIKEALNPVETK